MKDALSYGGIAVVLMVVAWLPMWAMRMQLESYYFGFLYGIGTSLVSVALWRFLMRRQLPHDTHWLQYNILMFLYAGVVALVLKVVAGGSVGQLFSGN